MCLFNLVAGHCYDLLEAYLLLQLAIFPTRITYNIQTLFDVFFTANKRLAISCDVFESDALN